LFGSPRCDREFCLSRSAVPRTSRSLILNVQRVPLDRHHYAARTNWIFSIDRSAIWFHLIVTMDRLQRSNNNLTSSDLLRVARKGLLVNRTNCLLSRSPSMRSRQSLGNSRRGTERGLPGPGYSSPSICASLARMISDIGSETIHKHSLGTIANIGCSIGR
jgi:hypothetical protein